MFAQGIANGTNDMRVWWWVQYELSATKIQRAFRSWNYARQFRRNYSRKLKILSGTTSNVPNLEESFRNIVSEDSTFDNKMCFWRAAVELRRAHKVHRTDLIIRALIDSGGDQSRAVVLLGTKDYAFLNKADVPMKLRRMFLPSMDSRTDTVDPCRPLMAESLRNMTRGVNEDGGDTFGGRQNSVNIIRALRGAKGKQIVYEKSREQRRAELFSILNSVVERSFLSKNHFGSKEHKRAQKVLHPPTIASKGWLDRQREEMMTPNLDSLIGRRENFS